MMHLRSDEITQHETADCTFYQDILQHYHRVDGPAFIRHSDGRMSWFIHGNRHRIDGPAIIQPKSDGEIWLRWYLDGKHYPFDEFLKITPISEEQKLLLKLQYGC
jgi:hypothetical protein